MLVVMVGLLASPWPAGAEKLTVAGLDGIYGDALQEGAELFQKENPGVEVELVKRPASELYALLTSSFQDAPGNVDVVMLEDGWAAEFMGNGWLLDLEKFGLAVDTDFIGNVMAAGRYPYERGAAHALPMVGNVALLAYRQDLFEKHGLGEPRDWLDVLEAAVKIDALESDIDGVVFQGAEGRPVVSVFLPLLREFGARVVGPRGNAYLNTGNAEAALKLFLKFEKLAPRGVRDFDDRKALEHLRDGRSAMALEVWPAWMPILDDPKTSKVAGQLQPLPSPGLIGVSSPLLEAWLLGASSGTRRTELAMKFVGFLTSGSVQKELALRTGLPPTRRSVYTDPETVSKYRWYPAQLEALESAVPRPRMANWPEVEAVLSRCLRQVLTEGVSPDEALWEANDRVQALLGR